MSRVLPDWPRVMRRPTAAAYCDMTVADFERAALCTPIVIAGKEMWSRVQLDEALERLTGERLPDWQQNCNLYAARDAA